MESRSRNSILGLVRDEEELAKNMEVTDKP